MLVAEDARIMPHKVSYQELWVQILSLIYKLLILITASHRIEIYCVNLLVDWSDI